MKQQTATILAISLVIIVLGVAGCSKDNTASNCPHYSKSIKGDPSSQLYLSNCIAKGNIQYGVIQNTEEAYFWYLIAEANGKELAKKELMIFDIDKLKTALDILEKYKTPEQRALLSESAQANLPLMEEYIAHFRNFHENTFESKTVETLTPEAEKLQDESERKDGKGNGKELAKKDLMIFDIDKYKTALDILQRYRTPEQRMRLSEKSQNNLPLMEEYIDHYRGRYLAESQLQVFFYEMEYVGDRKWNYRLSRATAKDGRGLDIEQIRKVQRRAAKHFERYKYQGNESEATE